MDPSSDPKYNLEKTTKQEHKVNLLLGVSGSVATIKLHELFTELSKRANVKIVATKDARHFIDKAWGLEDQIYGDEDDWRSWQKKGDDVMHIKLQKWAHMLLIAPLSANTLAKMAHGLCDNLLTCIVRAWEVDSKPIVVAPAMNTLMWKNELTDEHLLKICSVYQVAYLEPVVKKLACGDTGVGAMAPVEDIFELVDGFIARLEVKLNDLNYEPTLASWG